jgi:hypothetical protein
VEGGHGAGGGGELDDQVADEGVADVDRDLRLGEDGGL